MRDEISDPHAAVEHVRGTWKEILKAISKAKDNADAMAIFLRQEAEILNSKHTLKTRRALLENLFDRVRTLFKEQEIAVPSNPNIIGGGRGDR